MVNIPKNWSSLFTGKKLIQDLDVYDAKTFWNQIVWNDTLKASISRYDRKDNTDHHEFIQVLSPIKTFHLGDACVCFTKDADNYDFITRLKNLIIIFHETTYNLTMMDERDFRDHGTQLHGAQKAKRAEMEEDIVVAKADKEKTDKAQAEAIAKAMDDNIVSQPSLQRRCEKGLFDGPRVCLPLKENAWSRHQHLFEENVEKNQNGKGRRSTYFKNEGSGVVYAWGRY